MRKKVVTIQDVAQSAGVSVATVSRVLNNSPRVKERTRVKVQEAIRQLKYQPNLLGRDLRRDRTKRIMILLSSLDYPMLKEVYKGVEESARNYEYSTIICSTSGSKNKEEQLLQLLKNRFVDGVITFGTTLTAQELRQLNRDYPIVQCLEWMGNTGTPYVSVDNEKGARDAVTYLVKLGHRRIAMISRNEGQTALLREQGYGLALQEAGISYDANLIKYGDFSYESGVRLTKELLEENTSRPTAVFCINDTMAVGCANAARNLGYSVPEDLAIVGFDDTMEALMSAPPLTTMRQPKYELGHMAMEILMRKINGKEPETNAVLLPAQLVIRNSTVVKR
ncbi:LacI family transcriptional regulator [Paenibacillus sp. MZ04-78.2]|uniref:LacI family DNA-binding transcriptional regulator n=1 Tax=Paenibacillus sp. MZ04-78.2 TaxID=2962034 RepID=UPI0020B86D5D|nr:LacI family DNA-binding transcriptional regulator [Paenibacillus sp. MZ04-78.2]MCP3774469.1 LacI family transcriptional regulator [Paenibacillus sp. MZ04-78.2]